MKYFLGLTVVLCIFLGFSLSAQEVSSVKIEKINFEEFQKGDIITVKVLLNNLKEKLSSFQMYVKYDKEVIEYVATKNINDRFGHHTGDTLLCLVAENMKKSIREIDTIARFGGDEFVIMLPETKSSYSVAVKIQKRLLNIVKNKKWPVTFSIGAVTFNRPPRSFDEIIKKADSLMYSAKENGKNMIQHEVI